MLYQLYESQRALMEPFAEFAQATSRLLNNSANPYIHSPVFQRVAASYDLAYRLCKDYEKPEFDIDSVESNGVEIAIAERTAVDKPFCRLLRFKRFSDDPATLARMKKQPVVLIVAPLSGHYATLLRETVRAMLADHRVFITDWKNARTVPLEDGSFHLDDYVNYVQEFIRHIQGVYGNCHVMSVCQPTVPVLAGISLMASRGEKTPLSMVMMGGPIDARRSPTAVNNLAMQKSHAWFENNLIYRVPPQFPGAGRRVYPGFLQHAGFVAMNPDRHASSHWDYFEDLLKGDEDAAETHRKFYDEYNAVLDMDADYYLETIRTVFQDYDLVNGTWDVRNPEGQLERVRPQDITQTALLTVEGEHDDISGKGQTRAAHGLCSGIPQDERQHYEVRGAGHYGIFSGRRWREKVCPEISRFMLAHNDTADTPDAPSTVVVTLPSDSPTQTVLDLAPAEQKTDAVAVAPVSVPSAADAGPAHTAEAAASSSPALTATASQATAAVRKTRPARTVVKAAPATSQRRSSARSKAAAVPAPDPVATAVPAVKGTAKKTVKATAQAKTGTTAASAKPSAAKSSASKPTASKGTAQATAGKRAAATPARGSTVAKDVAEQPAGKTEAVE